MKQFFLKHSLVIGILLLSVILRFAVLGSVPTAITGDELIYPTTAKAIYLTGSDITGTWNPLSLFAFRYPPGELQAELPYAVHLFFNSFLPFTLFSYRLPFALMSVGIVLVLYLIAKKLFGEKTAVITGLLAAINPWFIVMGRTGYETTPATLFYLLGLYTVLVGRGKKILYAIPLFMLGFYSYIGTKILFIPFIALSLALPAVVNKKVEKKYIWSIAITSIAFVIFFVSQMAISGQSRLSDILLPNSPMFAQKVDSIRKISIQSPLLSIMVNKYTMFGEHLVQKFFRVFSASYLFGDGDNFFLQARHSFFYPADSVLVILGLAALFAYNHSIFVLIAAFIILGALPHVIHRTQSDFSAHITLMFPFIILALGFGLSYLRDILPGAMKKLFAVACIALYVVSLGNFVLVYFYQLPMQGAGDFQMRTLSKYLSIAGDGTRPIIVYSTQGADIFKKYLLYTNSIKKTSIAELSKPMKPDAAITFNVITFTSCDNSVDVTDGTTLHIVSNLCGFPTKNTETHTKLSRLSDGGTIFDIYNNEVCNRDTLSTYPHGITLDDFAIESMPADEFCTTFVSK